MASLGIAAGTLTSCNCITRDLLLLGGNGVKLAYHLVDNKFSSVSAVQCRLNAHEKAPGRPTVKDAVDLSSSAVNATSEVIPEAPTASPPCESLASSTTDILASKKQTSKSSKPDASGRELQKVLMQRLKLDKLMDELVGFMAPRDHGDIRDVILMSLSFAVLVYISQRLVCAYFVLRHMTQSF